MDSGNSFTSGKRSRPLGLKYSQTQSNKRQHTVPDFSALPTHLPGTPSSFASILSPFPASYESAPKNDLDREADRNCANFHTHEVASGTMAASELLVASQPLVPDTEGSPRPQDGSGSSEFPAPSPENSNKEPVYIEGTNISLQTEEDIAKWIAERRKKWPTKKNVEAKQKNQEEKAPEQEKDVPKQNMCKFYARNKRCKFGAKCRNVHESSTGLGPQALSTGHESSTRKRINGVLVNIPQRYKNDVKGAGSLFTKLVQRDLYEHQNNVIIDFIQYLSSQGIINPDATSL